MILWFWCVFPCWLVTLNIFSWAFWPSASPLLKFVSSVLLTIFKLFSFYWVIYVVVMLNINPSSVISVVNIFFHPIGCFFFLLMVSFAVQKLLTLTVSHLFIFTCISFTLRVRSKKYDHITQSDIQIQYNTYQNINGIFHRTRTNNFKMCVCVNLVTSHI